MAVITIPSNISLFDDSKRVDGSNGQPTKASIQKEYQNGLNAIGCRYRPLYSFWGGTDYINSWNAGTGDATLHQRWIHVSPGAAALRATTMIVQSSGQNTATQSVNLSVGATVITAPESPSRVAIALPKWPLHQETAPDLTISLNTDMAAHDVRLGSEGANSPQLHSGVVFEPWNLVPLPSSSTTYPAFIPNASLRSGSPILATDSSAGAASSQQGYADYFRRIHAGRRSVIGWSGVSGTAAPTDGAIVMNVDAANWRYLLGQQYGVGGITPTLTGRGMSIPLRTTASGVLNTIRLYVSVLACMSAGGATGSIGMYTFNTSGTPSVAALTNGPAITGTTYQWYGASAPFAPATDPYATVDVRTVNPFTKHNRILPVARSSSGGVFVKIRAFSIAAYHSVL